MFSIESSPLGRIVVAPHVPAGHRLFYTTIDSRGAIDETLTQFVGKPIAQCNQVHGATVTRCGGGDCDALWSDVPSALAIKVADCLPVSLIGDGKIANVHCGWRGAVQNIVDKTLDHVTATDAWLGPTIRVCCFEVGEEVAVQFPEEFVDRTSYAKPHVDIPAFVRSRLNGARVHDSELCTRCDGSIFHSYRRDGRTGGRNLAVLTMD